MFMCACVCIYVIRSSFQRTGGVDSMDFVVERVGKAHQLSGYDETSPGALTDRLLISTHDSNGKR